MQVTRTELPPLPDPVQECLHAIRVAGGRAWLVGGAVRDLLQGITPEDFDLASDLTPAQLAAFLPNSDLREAALGTCRTVIAQQELTVTTLRAEGGYLDQRHPEHVQFVSDLSVDAQRRDFTVNALYFDPIRNELLDPCGGRADLEAGLLRAIGDPATRFEEDPLRLLRLVRFAAAADLQIDAATAAAARATALYGPRPRPSAWPTGQSRPCRRRVAGDCRDGRRCATA
jgi:tRNA nucleotidyltransferase (CCA-adding enzyme)